MIVFPVSKVNIGLRITGKREDGFHNIETVFYPVNLTDALEFVINEHHPAKDLLTVTGFNTGSDPEKNLVMKAVKKLREIADLPFLRIHLHKAIPTGAGLGGGSSDAATLLNGLNKYFALNIDHNELLRLALELGSDCPFFINCMPAFAEGRGELLSPMEPVLKGSHFVLLNPKVGISTAEAYRHCKPSMPMESLKEAYHLPLAEWRNHIVNDFEEYAISVHPVIGEIKEGLYNTGAVFSLMSGSGSSVYGIFSEQPALPGWLSSYVIYEGML
jgi:4-diphosphocytidyl-2-C-methyl-D-erythritol kinase